jgi:DNA-binding XRE family transcriptional regulator
LRYSWWRQAELFDIFLSKEKEDRLMMQATLMLFAELIFIVIIVVLIIRVVKKYTHSKPVRDEKKQSAKTLGEVLRAYRTENKMTQEFVAESLGVSRQAVSKWESGASDPSTTNLIALAKLYKIEPEELIRSITE